MVYQSSSQPGTVVFAALVWQMRKQCCSCRRAAAGSSIVVFIIVLVRGSVLIVGSEAYTRHRDMTHCVKGVMSHTCSDYILYAVSFQTVES